MSIKDKLISNSIFLVLFRFSDMFFFMLFWLILGKTLPPASYGVVALSLQIVSLVSSVGMLGMGTTTNKLVPEFLKTGKKDELQGIIHFSMMVTFIASAVLSLCFVGLSILAPNLIKLDMQTMLLTAVSSILATMAVIMMNIQMGYQNMKKVFVTSFTSYLLLVMLTVASVYLGFGYTGAIVSYLISSAAIFASRLQKKFFMVSKHPVVNTDLIFRYAAPAFVVSLLVVLSNNTQFITLSIMETPEVTGLFAVAMKIAFVLSVPPIISRGLFPIISELSVDKANKPKQGRLVSLTFRYEAFMLLTMAAFMIVFAKQLVMFFSGPEYLQAVDVLPLVILASMFAAFSDHFMQSLYAVGEPNKYRDANLVSTIAYIALMIPLTYYFSSTGLAVAFLAYSILLFVLSLTYTKASIPMKLPAAGIAKIIVSLIISVAPLMFVRHAIPGIWSAIPVAAVSMALNVLILSKLGFFIEEDLKVIDFIIAKLPFLRKEAGLVREYFSTLVKKRAYSET